MILEEISTAYPDRSRASVANWTGQLDRFRNQIAVNDFVLMPRKPGGSTVAIGRIKSDYQYVAAESSLYRHVRQVDWLLEAVPRSSFDARFQASLGSLLTVFGIDRAGALERVRELVEGGSGAEDASQNQGAPETLPELAEAAPTPITVRQLLKILAIERRGANFAADATSRLAESGLRSVQPIEAGTLTQVIDIIRIESDVTQDRLEASAERDVVPGEPVDFTISTLESANTIPVSVAPDEALDLAVTRMLLGNYSQLAVVEEGALVGAITWQSIAVAHIHGRVLSVIEAMVTAPPVVSPHEALRNVVAPVEAHGYVFVSGDEEALGGIVTVADLAEVFGKDRLPHMQVEEIERLLRKCVTERLTDEDIRDSSAQVNTVERVTMGAYPFILRTPACWRKIGWTGVDRETLAQLIADAATVRNDLMHFSPDPIEPLRIDALDGLLRILRAVEP